MTIFSQRAKYQILLSLLACYSLVTISFGQIPAASQSPTLQAFQQEQQALGQQMQALITQGATPQQIAAWHQQNASRFQVQQQRAQALAAASTLQPLPYITDIEIPEGASQEMVDFLATRADLANRRAQIHNQAIAGLTVSSGTGAILGAVSGEGVTFIQQNQAELTTQAQRAQTLATQSAEQPMPMPLPLAIPPGSSSQMAALLTARDQFMRDRITFSNQYVTATAAVRDAAMAQWMQQNASRFQQVQALAQNLSQASTTPKN